MVLLCLSFSVEQSRDVPARRVGRGRTRRPTNASESRPGLQLTTPHSPTSNPSHTLRHDPCTAGSSADQFADADVEVPATHMEASLPTSVSRHRQWLQQIAESSMWADVCIEHEQPCDCNVIPADSSFWTEVLVFEPVKQSRAAKPVGRGRARRPLRNADVDARSSVEDDTSSRACVKRGRGRGRLPLKNVATRPGLLRDNLSHGMEMANLQSSLAHVASDDPPAPHHKDSSPQACAERRPWLKRRSDAAMWAQVCVQWRREEQFDERI